MFLVHILLLGTSFLMPECHASHSLHTWTHLFFLFPQRPFNMLKSVLLRYRPALLPHVSSMPPFSPFISKSSRKCFWANIPRGGIKAGVEGRAMLRRRAGEAAVAQQYTACRSEGCWERRALGLHGATRLPRRRPADLVAVGQGQTLHDCDTLAPQTQRMVVLVGSAGHLLPLFRMRTEVHDSAQES